SRRCARWRRCRSDGRLRWFGVADCHLEGLGEIVCPCCCRGRLLERTQRGQRDGEQSNNYSRHERTSAIQCVAIQTRIENGEHAALELGATRHRQGREGGSGAVVLGCADFLDHLQQLAGI